MELRTDIIRQVCTIGEESYLEFDRVAGKLVLFNERGEKEQLPDAFMLRKDGGGMSYWPAEEGMPELGEERTLPVAEIQVLRIAAGQAVCMYTAVDYRHYLRWKLRDTALWIDQNETSIRVLSQAGSLVEKEEPTYPDGDYLLG